MPNLLSIQVARPQHYGQAEAVDPHDRPWTTAFFKMPISGSVFVSRTNIVGDAQADLQFHGGPDKAVLAYSADHYAYWREHINQPTLPYGAFGENLTIAGLDESQVCVGDTWQADPVVFQVTQPRQPCWKLSRRWRIDDLARQVIANGKSGWYLRVLAEGEIAAGCEMTLIGRPHPTWTVQRASDLMHHRKNDLAAAAELAAMPELSAAWRETLQDRIVKRTS